MAGKHWVITGASRGIGLEMVGQLLASKVDVTALVRQPSKAKALQALAEGHSHLRILEADVTRDSDVIRAAESLNGKTIDVLVNNAGIYMEGDGQLSELDPKIVEQTFIVNALGPMRTTKAFLPLLRKSSRPVIANITSKMGSIADNGSGGSYAYRMSKSALNMFTKTLSIEFPQAIVLSLHPGWVKTDMGGSNAPTEPRDSASGLIHVIREAAAKDSGRFFDFRNESIKW